MSGNKDFRNLCYVCGTEWDMDRDRPEKCPNCERDELRELVREMAEALQKSGIRLFDSTNLPLIVKAWAVLNA